LYGGRARLEDALHAERPEADIRIVSIRSLLWLADAVASGNLKHQELVRLLTAGGNLDFLIDLLERFAAGDRDRGDDAGPVPDVPLITATVHTAPAYWVATIERDEATSPEQFVESVIRKRHLLGVSDDGSSQQRPRAGDWVCFSVRGKGIVGHGQIDAAADGPRLLRGAHRFSEVFSLQRVEIYDAPVALGPEAGFGRIASPSLMDDGGPVLALISSEMFAEVTARAADRGPEGLRPTA
jgi:hypothetical protein